MPQLIAAAGQHIHAHSIGTIQGASASAAYGVTDDFTVSVRLPYVLRTDIREGHHAHLPGGVVSNTVDFRGDSSGLGDLTLLGQYRFLNNTATRTEAAFLFGVKAPTGATNRIDAQGLLFETEFQPGSGSTDLLLGAAFTQRFGAWSFDANVLGTIAGRGAQDTKLGDRFLYNAALSYRLVGYAPPHEHASLPSSAMAHGPVPHRHAHPLDKIPAPPAMDRRRGARTQWRVARQGRDRQRDRSEFRRSRSPALAGLAYFARRLLGFRVVRHPDRQPDERAAIEDRVSRAHRRHLRVLTERDTVHDLLAEHLRPGSRDRSPRCY